MKLALLALLRTQYHSGMRTILLWLLCAGCALAQYQPPIGGGRPTGAAGGALSGTYPSPGLGTFTPANLATALGAGGVSTLVLGGAAGSCVDGIVLGQSSGVLTCQALSQSFSVIASGTNTTAAMIIGAGSSLTTGSTGTITANRLGTLPAGTAGAPSVPIGTANTGFSAPNGTTIYINHGGATTGQLNSTQWVAPGAVALGCNSSACVELVRSSAILQVKLGDASAFATLQSKYDSSDGTAGVTVTTCTGYKDGLCVSGT